MTADRVSPASGTVVPDRLRTGEARANHVDAVLGEHDGRQGLGDDEDPHTAHPSLSFGIVANTLGSWAGLAATMLVNMLVM